MTQKSTKPLPQVPLARQPCRVLVVDDHPVNRTLLVRLLNRGRFTPNQASNGSEAFKLWQKWQPHLILMDLMMPEVNGYEATRLIRAAETLNSKTATAIIALTAENLTSLAPQLHTMGFDSVMTKPVRPDILFRLMAKHLNLQYDYAADSANHIKVTP